MRLAAIYNLFDGIELLKYSINSIKSSIDEFIFVYQTTSNFGEKYDPYPEILETLKETGIKNHLFVYFEPTIKAGQKNETQKRQLGIDYAKQLNCTHFIQMDCDECYKDFGKAKELYINSGFNGSVCKIYTYFKKPKLRFENPDGYFVPFIHKLNENTVTGSSKYPFYCDKTRQINEENIIELPVFMHHFSWIRSNIGMKARNSSANVNILRGDLLEYYHNSDTGAGSYIKDYEQKLIEVDNYFNIEI